MSLILDSERAALWQGDCIDFLKYLPDKSVDAVITDPPYVEINRAYGRFTEAEWWVLMRAAVGEIRRVLTPRGSAVFIIAPNSEYVGRMRPWVFDFMAWIARDWNMPQDAYWWNHAAVPTVHAQRVHGLMRPSLKPCVWGGAPDCLRNQDAILWTQSESMKAVDREDRALKKHPSGYSHRAGKMGAVCDERGGSTPLNVLPIANTNSSSSAGAKGHGAGTPYALCEWWVKYISPPDGVVLDPFIGSGTVGEAALRNGRSTLGSEKMPEYAQIAK